jgi:hypothetical protein
MGPAWLAWIMRHFYAPRMQFPNPSFALVLLGFIAVLTDSA